MPFFTHVIRKIKMSKKTQCALGYGALWYVFSKPVCMNMNCLFLNNLAKVIKIWHTSLTWENLFYRKIKVHVRIFNTAILGNIIKLKRLVYSWIYFFCLNYGIFCSCWIYWVGIIWYSTWRISMLLRAKIKFWGDMYGLSPFW